MFILICDTFEVFGSMAYLYSSLSVFSLLEAAF